MATRKCQSKDQKKKRGKLQRNPVNEKLRSKETVEKIKMIKAYGKDLKEEENKY